MNTAIYARVSTDDQSCDRQLRDLNAFAERAGYKIIETVTETASGNKNDRKERAKLMALAKARKIKIILVTEMSRWGRSLTDLISTLQELNAYGVSVVAQNGMTFDLSTPHGKMLAGVLGSLAEFERDLLKERVKSGLAARKARGNTLGRKPGHNWKTASRENKVKELLASGASCRQIAKELKLSVGSVANIKKRLSEPAVTVE